jgi:hypothetical protein
MKEKGKSMNSVAGKARMRWLYKLFGGDGKQPAAYEINITKDGVSVNGSLLSTPLNMDGLTGIFGRPRYPRIAEGEDFKGSNNVAIWDNAGLYAIFKDDGTATLAVQLDFDRDWKPNFDMKKWRPASLFADSLLVDGVPYREADNLDRRSRSVMKKLGNWTAYLTEMENPQGKNHFWEAEFSYKAPRVSTGKYRQKKPDGEPLYFKNFNFKLAIVQSLMYDREFITPKLDAWDFAADFAEREIDVDSEGYEPIPEIRKYFRDLQIDSRLAAEVTELVLDGGNDIYTQICPFWDGEDDMYDIKAIEEAELVQFPNLKRITCDPGWIGKKARAALVSRGVEVGPA